MLLSIFVLILIRLKPYENPVLGIRKTDGKYHQEKQLLVTVWLENGTFPCKYIAHLRKSHKEILNFKDTILLVFMNLDDSESLHFKGKNHHIL